MTIQAITPIWWPENPAAMASSVPEAAKADLLVADQRRTINVQNVVKSLRIGPHRRRLHVRGR